MLSDINIVVQWKLPTTVSSFVQRAGRAARGSGRTGIAVLLVEKTVYDADDKLLPIQRAPRDMQIFTGCFGVHMAALQM